MCSPTEPYIKTVRARIPGNLWCNNSTAEQLDNFFAAYFICIMKHVFYFCFNIYCVIQIHVNQNVCAANEKSVQMSHC